MVAAAASAGRCCRARRSTCTLPLLGDVHLVTSLFFDIGVYLVVVGLVLDILRSLGAEMDRHIEADRNRDGGLAVDERRERRSEPVVSAVANAGDGPCVAGAGAGRRVLVGCGVNLLLERSLTRILLGRHPARQRGEPAVPVSGGRAGGAPIVGTGPVERMSDPLPQAMVLTAIVITFGHHRVPARDGVPQLAAHRPRRGAGRPGGPRRSSRLAAADEAGAVDLGGEGPNGDPEQVDPEPTCRRLRRGEESR